MEPAAGDTIRDRYTLAEHLGTGGFAAVWRARDEQRDRDVALKLPSMHAHDEETVLSRFKREQQLLEPFTEGLSHGTVVRYLDGDLENEPRYIALELLDGDPLAEAFSSDALGTGVRRQAGRRRASPSCRRPTAAPAALRPLRQTPAPGVLAP